MNPVYVLSAAIVTSSAAIIFSVRYYALAAIATVKDAVSANDTSLTNHHSILGVSLGQTQAALADTQKSLGEFAQAIPKSATVSMIVANTTGGTDTRASHVVQFKS
jgi:hypothetical protein